MTAPSSSTKASGGFTRNASSRPLWITRSALGAAATGPESATGAAASRSRSWAAGWPGPASAIRASARGVRSPLPPLRELEPAVPAPPPAAPAAVSSGLAAAGVSRRAAAGAEPAVSDLETEMFERPRTGAGPPALSAAVEPRAAVPEAPAEPTGGRTCRVAGGGAGGAGGAGAADGGAPADGPGAVGVAGTVAGGRPAADESPDDADAGDGADGGGAAGVEGPACAEDDCESRPSSWPARRP